MNILSSIQTELNAPKNQRNNFGNYNYRSCEDILEGLKPLLKEYECSVVVSDEMQLIGDRFYVKATARLLKNNEVIGESTAYAREPLNKKGMDEAQITGATSSYARKYALNGLFAIDDNKDADTNEHHNNSKNNPVNQNVEKIQDKFNGVDVNARTEIAKLLDSGKIPNKDKEEYINKLKTNPSLVSQKTVNEIKAKYFG